VKTSDHGRDAKQVEKCGHQSNRQLLVETEKIYPDKYPENSPENYCRWRHLPGTENKQTNLSVLLCCCRRMKRIRMAGQGGGL
jgi:hypothetical protein